MSKQLQPMILFGGDYCPEQWDEATVDQDIALLKAAHVNVVVLSIFTWALLEVADGVYDFTWLDRTLEKLQKADIQVCLGTPTSAQPAWLSLKYPEVLPVDVAGRKRNHGMRVFFCVNSQKYREKAAALASKLAERYHDYPNLIAWHVANEYGTYCYCEHCQAAFRSWLKKRYGSIAGLNAAWHTTFWGRQVTSFQEVMVPSELNDDYRFNPAVELDYQRFMTDSTLACFTNERDAIQQFSPDKPIYSNISGYIKKLNQFKFAKEMDVVGWDNYPSPQDPLSLVAMKHDIMRGLKAGKPYWIAEQSPNQQNWQPYNKLKKPGEVRTIAFQGLAHGADACLFFQLKQSLAGQEKFHGAFIDHSGTGASRTYQEVQALGADLAQVGPSFVGSHLKNKVAFYFDWESWWSLENASGPSKDLKYLNEVHHLYQSFYQQNIPVDFIAHETDLAPYKIVVAASDYLLDTETVARLERFVANGGTFIANYRTGVADQNDCCRYGLPPGLLQHLLGVKVAETDGLLPQEQNSLVEIKTGTVAGTASLVCDLLTLTSGRALYYYGADFYAGTPAITVNDFGRGKSYYLGTKADPAFLARWITKICQDLQITSKFKMDSGIELVQRENEKQIFNFVINHQDQVATIDFGTFTGVDLLTGKTCTGLSQLAPRAVLILQEEKEN